MPISQQGSLNTTSLVVPDLYVQIVSPQNLVINGVPTNIIGVVGTASWGPVNQPVAISTMSDYAASFGSVFARKYDLGTAVAIAVQQGASNFRCVRVSDGTDSAASLAIGLAAGAFALLLSARYSGSLGNSIEFTLAQASVPGQWQATVSMPGLVPEVYRNIAAPTPAGFWQNLASAINTGSGPLRGPSQMVVATVGTVTSPTPTTTGPLGLAGGSDGASGVTSVMLVGQDFVPRTGMFSLRSQGCGIGVLADVDDATQWTGASWVWFVRGRLYDHDGSCWPRHLGCSDA